MSDDKSEKREFCEADTALMQKTYDSILKDWPLKADPKNPVLAAAWKKAWGLCKEAQAALEEPFKMGTDEIIEELRFPTDEEVKASLESKRALIEDADAAVITTAISSGSGGLSEDGESLTVNAAEKPKGGRGGDMTFGAGAGSATGEYMAPGDHGSLIFFLQNPEPGEPKNEALRLEATGEVFVNGKQVDQADGRLVYGAFKAWLTVCMLEAFGNASVSAGMGRRLPNAPGDMVEAVDRIGTELKTLWAIGNDLGMSPDIPQRLMLAKLVLSAPIDEHEVREMTRKINARAQDLERSWEEL